MAPVAVFPTGMTVMKALNTGHSFISAKRLQFGCRLMAFMTEEEKPGPKQAAEILDFLIKNPNSLKAQSQGGSHPSRDGVNSPKHEEDLMGLPQQGNPDGWGIAAFSPKLHVERGLSAAHQDPRFNTAAETAASRNPTVLMAHIRHSSFHGKPKAKDLHPFRLENWVSMLNGAMNSTANSAIKDALSRLYGPLLGKLPRGKTSAETGLYYFLGKLKATYGHTDSAKLSRLQIQQAFAETIWDFCTNAKLLPKPLQGEVMGLQGSVRLRPAANFVFSDGNILLAYRKGRKLYLSKQVSESGKHAFWVSSEPLQPENRKDKREWLELPEDHILTLSRTGTGQIEPTLTPLECVAPGTPAAG